jgi:hypothetical protein
MHQEKETEASAVKPETAGSSRADFQKRVIVILKISFGLPGMFPGEAYGLCPH